MAGCSGGQMDRCMVMKRGRTFLKRDARKGGPKNTIALNQTPLLGQIFRGWSVSFCVDVLRR